MDDIVISVENLSKKYDLGVIGTGTFSKDLNRWWANLRHKPDPYAKIGESDHGNRVGKSIMALDDVSFNVSRGEVLGIIGRNGAGKSTLLKILSQVTAPSSGKVKIKGRIGSLLEVGTGFHPELTGRENLFLNGAILGMSKAEVSRKFDEIVEFAGVEKFIDTPVKRYSSGMYVRLAFAVAAHLEPEILIVDEVLAVGDAEFQKKCLGKMSDVAHEGRTVLFVSHNMGAVKNLCTKAILLSSGSKNDEGIVESVVSNYLSSQVPPNFQSEPIIINELGLTVESITINKEINGLVIPFKPATIEILVNSRNDIDYLSFEVLVSNVDTNGLLFATNAKQTKNIMTQIKTGINKVICQIHSFNLSSGDYQLGISISEPWVKHYYQNTDLLRFNVSETLMPDGRTLTLPVYGHVYLEHDWSIDYE
ncbi:MAG: ATP-binding cassette domain-containing protein [Anaerolineae bacterium]|nr:ATP-binding cassette domain-containing protein [Anaerolineae bacterium]